MSNTPLAYQPGLFLSVSPTPAKVSQPFPRSPCRNTLPAGIQVSVSDFPTLIGEFVTRPGPLLNRTSPHKNEVLDQGQSGC